MRGAPLLPEQFNVTIERKQLRDIADFVQVHRPPALPVNGHERFVNDLALILERVGAASERGGEHDPTTGFVGQVVEILHDLTSLIFELIENFVALLRGNRKNEIPPGEDGKRKCRLASAGRTDESYVLALLPVEIEREKFVP